MSSNDHPQDSSKNDKWRKQLTDTEYHITREGGTEPAFSGQYDQFKEEGVYHCICCHTALFNSDKKYDSGSGWPSYTQALTEQTIRYITDRRHHWVRIEVRCATCDAHLGHVFDDGPAPTGKRYCINSTALAFIKE